MNTDEMTEALFQHVADFPGVRRKLHAILAPDSPLVWHTVTDTGAVIDVRAALVALGRAVQDAANYSRRGGFGSKSPHQRLAAMGIPEPLADLCIRLAEEADQ